MLEDVLADEDELEKDRSFAVLADFLLDLQFLAASGTFSERADCSVDSSE